MDKGKLKTVCYYLNERVNLNTLNTSNYISTENMLQDRGGVTNASSLPNSTIVSAFSKGDVLVSNIRPYFKKIWLANTDGGCSNDVLVFRARENYDSKFLYYVLSSDSFFDFATATAKGTKMPRGDKSAIMEYTVPKPLPKEQLAIARILSSLDDKIELNNKINKNLEEQAQAAFTKWIIEDNANQPLGSLFDIADINPTRILKRGDKAIYVEMANLPTQGSFPVDWEMKEFAGGMKFRNGDTLMARITPCLENGKRAYINFLGDDDVAFGSTEYIVITSREGYCKEIFYFLTRYTDFVNYAVLNMNGSSGRQRVSSDIVGQYILNIPTKESSRAFEQIAAPIMRLIKINSIENQKLAAIRDSLLPKLMSGEIKVV